MPFKKGQSGNPKGRPKANRELQDLCKQHTVLAVTKIVEVLQNPEDQRVAMIAAKEILDRGWGRAPQSVSHENSDGSALQAVIQIVKGEEKSKA